MPRSAAAWRNHHKNTALSRQPFTLTDDQAAKLLTALRPIAERHPVDTQSNRPFVRDFIRAVHQATGRTFSPAIYRRLLNAYAPERRPSTTTLSIEKEFVEQELASASTPAAPPFPPSGGPEPLFEQRSTGAGNMAILVRKAVEDALSRHTGLAADRWSSEQQMAQAHIADLSARLAASERALSDSRAQAARLAADLHFAQETAARCQAQLAAVERSAQAQAEAHTLALNRLAVELDEIRKFAMRSIDDVRGETRAERDRRIHAEGLLKTNEKMTELFRQMAYQRGGAIPAELRMERK
ncbi:hypothetical protein ACFQ09_12650 [Massilia norwichensis]|uniref:KfrA N-terminal DNA-binding domain-containing protein n=1 Tax=Massilia norwichensis TaxID=1442366 RepID=A0ABT2ACC8_9BURK|nr:hypothetical protein [Massilia norwichensis]MCS0591839.1 hypothetical protein [Massilia norwichensis]